LADRLGGQRVRAHDTLEEFGCEVLVADAQKVKGLAPLACKTDTVIVIPRWLARWLRAG